MKRLLQTAGLAAALAVAAAPAHAVTLVSNNYCGGNTFSTCAFIQSDATYNAGTNQTTLVLTVTNTNPTGSGSVFTAIGIGNLPSGYTLVSATTNNPGEWTFSTSPNGLSGAGIAGDVIGFNAVAPPSQTGLMPGESVTFTYVFSGNVNLSTIQYSIHDQGGAPAGCESSTKLVIGSSGGTYSANTATCGPPTNVVPEPASMTLLGTGLAGLGGFLRRRRASTKA